MYTHADQARLAERWLVGCKNFSVAETSFSAIPVVAVAVRGASDAGGPPGFVESAALNIRFGEGFRAHFRFLHDVTNNSRTLDSIMREKGWWVGFYRLRWTHPYGLVLVGAGDSSENVPISFEGFETHTEALRAATIAQAQDALIKRVVA